MGRLQYAVKSVVARRCNSTSRPESSGAKGFVFQLPLCCNYPRIWDKAHTCVNTLSVELAAAV